MPGVPGVLGLGTTGQGSGAGSAGGSVGGCVADVATSKEVPPPKVASLQGLTAGNDLNILNGWI